MSRFPYVVVALPPLVLAAIGVTHPSDLNPASSEYWRNLHIAILAVFPLLGFSPWLIVRGYRRWVSWLAGILGFIYAAFYTALDVLAGIGAGGLEHEGHPEGEGTLFRLGDALGAIGSYALIAAVAVAGITTVQRFGYRAIPGALLVLLGGFLFLERHIYFPLGVLGQVSLAVGWVLLLVVQRRRAASTALTT